MMRIFFALLLLLPAGTSSWEKISVATAASLRGVSPVDDFVVWASGTVGTVLRSLNSGHSWSVITVPGAADQDFRGIRAFDRNTAVIISAGKAEEGKARIYRTADGGQNWKLVYQANTPGIFFDAIAFWDRRHGIVLSDPVGGRFALFITDDGGASWKRVSATGIPPALANEGAFAASNSCLAIEGSQNAWFATGGAKVSRVFRSHDRGKTWEVVNTPMHPGNASSGIFSLAFRDALHGIAVGGDYAQPERSDLPNVLTTGDGGKSWQAGPPTVPAGIYLSSVAYEHVDASKMIVAVAVGTKGLFHQSSAGTWKKESDENLNAIAFTPTGWGWPVGPKGTILLEKKTVQIQLK